MNRKTLFWPLLLAAAFTLGVLAAQVHAGAIFLPLVTRAWDGEPVATPPPPGTVMVQSVHYDASKQRFYGELVNYTACTVTASGVTLYLLNADGLPVANMTGYSMAPLLAPGERTPFRVYWYDPLPAWDSYLIYPDWHPVERLTVQSAAFTERQYGGWQLTVTVHNQLPVRVESLTLGIVVYGIAGEVIGYDARAEVLGPLEPGGTLEVEHIFYPWDWDAEDQPVACAAFAIPCGGSLYSLMEQEP
ncbi:unnamed protein product [marine sediment metagenome]|uniref:Uncharacterized protein n=1 Tax=marine sediment metagenome TaxID=412755 RepID=X1TK18_9ZZZZ